VTLRRHRDTADYEQALRSCLDKVERLSILTRELLTLARLDAEQGRAIAVGTVALAPVLDGVVRRLGSEAERRHVTIAVHKSQALSLSVRCGEGLADLVFTNLLDNAVKFTPPGGQVLVDAAAEGPEVIVAITDSGPGIPPDEIPLVFERFYRGRAARAKDSRGFGLGLAISRAAVENHGGQLSVESAAGCGSTFRVRFPVAT
jgi:two-component system OmpR family sensor kinase